MKVTNDQIIVGFIKGRPDLAKELLTRSGVSLDTNIDDSMLLDNVVMAYQYSPKFRKEFAQVFNGVMTEYTNFAGEDFNRAWEIQSGSSGFNDMNWNSKNFAGDFSNFVGEFENFNPTPTGEDLKTTPYVLTPKGEKAISGNTIEASKGVLSWLKNTFTTSEGKFDSDKANSILNTGFGILTSVKNKKGSLTNDYSQDPNADANNTTPTGWWSNLPMWQKASIIGVPVIVLGLVAWKLSKGKK